MSARQPFQGRCNIGQHSSLRKRMRAARRGFITAEMPDEKALMRHAWYRRKKAGDALRALTGSSTAYAEQDAALEPALRGAES